MNKDLEIKFVKGIGPKRAEALNSIGIKELSDLIEYFPRRYLDRRTIVKLDKLTDRRVGDLINELDMLGIVTAQVISKGRYGRSKRIHLTVPHKQVREVLESDFRLSKIFDMDEI